jgi:hypothetical protein
LPGSGNPEPKMLVTERMKSVSVIETSDQQTVMILISQLHEERRGWTGTSYSRAWLVSLGCRLMHVWKALEGRQMERRG